MVDFTTRYLSVCANASDSNVTSDLWLVQDRTSGLVTAVFLLLFLVIGLPWNLLVIVTIVKQKLYTQPTIILLLSLVITDLVLLVFVIPVIIVTGIAGEYIFGDSDNVRCKTCITGSMGHAFSLMSVYNITLMSCDRFLFIYRPMKYERWVTSCRTVVVIMVACFFLILVSMTPLLGFGNVIFYPPLVSCIFDMTIQHDYYPVLLFVVCFLPVPFLLLSNAWVIYIVQKNIRAIYVSRRAREGTDKNTSDNNFYKTMKRKRQQKQVHMVQVFGCLLCSNMITWVPIVVVCFLSILPVSGLDIPSAFTATAQVLYMSQVLLHPLVETALIKDVRHPLKKLLCCCMRTRAAVDQGEAPPDHCGCFGDHDNDEVPPSGCHGFLSVCGAAVLMQYPLRHFSRTSSRASSQRSNVELVNS